MILVGYDGMFLGLIFIIFRGVEFIVCFINNVKYENFVYFYGFYLRVLFDGWVEDVI